MKNMKKTLSTSLALAGLLFGLTSMAPATADAAWFSCNPTEVLELSNRIHVRCSNTTNRNGNTIRYLAISNSSWSKASRFVSLANAAILSGKWFRVDIPTSSSTNTTSCSSSNCRTPSGFGVME